MNATATLNKWNGDGVPNPYLYCWSCRKSVTVANIPDLGGALLVRLCANCLHDGLMAIYQAILDDKSYKPTDSLGSGRHVTPRADSDDDGYPD